ncbi:MAG: tetratricopeptide repeat protein [bacterium]|nr:tetratricopeptide repeat protein [bacterium]
MRQTIKRMTISLVVGSLLGCAHSGEVLAPLNTASETTRGVVVEEVVEGSALAKAGLESGDVLWAWRRLPQPPANPDEAHGELDSPFDWLWLGIEQAPRGRVELTGARGQETQIFTVHPGLWDTEVRPWMPDPVLEHYLRGRQQLEAGKAAQAVSWWEKAATATRDRGLRCWIFLRLGDQWADQGEWEKAHAAYRSALAETEESLPRMALWWAIGNRYKMQSEFELARQANNSALEIQQKAWGTESLAVAQSLYRLGSVAWRRGNLARAMDHHQRALEIAQDLAPDSLTVASILNGLGLVAYRRGDLERATSFHQRALEIKKELAPDSLTMANSLNNLGLVAYQRGDLERAASFHQRALEIKKELAPNSLAVVESLNNLGGVAWTRGDLDGATEFHQRALEIGEKLAPASILVAVILNNLGNIAYERGSLDEAREFHLRALKIHQRLAPISLGLAGILNNLGMIADDLGDLRGARDFYQRARKIANKLAPESPLMGRILNNRGSIALARGDLSEAVDFFLRSLEVEQKLAPQSPGLVGPLNNLGAVASDHGNWLRAKDFFQRVLEIHQRLAPDSLYVARSLSNLGLVAQHLGDTAQAAELYQRALKIRQKQAPDALAVAASLNDLGGLAGKRGDLDQAADFHQRALEIQRKLAPDSLNVAETLQNLGLVAWKRGDMGGAADYFRYALETQQKLAPDSFQAANLFNLMGRLHHQTNPHRLDIVNDFFHRAIDTMAKQMARLGGSHDVRSGYRTKFDAYYRDAIEVQLELNQGDLAFHTLERSRARSFLEQLAERDTVFTTDIPEKLDRERVRLAVRFDRTQQQLTDLNPRDHAEQIEQLLDQLRQLRDEARDIEEKIRRASPRLAALQYPQPLDIDAARAALDPGNEFELAREEHSSARTIRETTFGKESLEVAESLNDLGLVAWYQGNLDQAMDFYQRALKIKEELAPDSLSVAASLSSLGGVAGDRGDLDQATDFHQRALEIQQKLVPDSLDVATSLYRLGSVVWQRGDLARAAELSQRALEIQQRLAPDSLPMANTLINLGAVLYERGDLTGAADYCQRALEIQQKLAPDSSAMAVSLSNLGNIAYSRAELDEAMGLFQRALEIQQRLTPDSLAVATSLHNLATVAWEHGDLDRAMTLGHRALRIQQELAPDRLEYASSLDTLGLVANERGDLDRAADFFHRALEIRKRLAPEGLDVAYSLNNLGILAWRRGDLDRAVEFFQSSLDIRQHLAPGSADMADSLTSLGGVAWRRRDLKRAAEFHQRALAIQQKLAPDSRLVAQSLSNLGDVARASGDLERAAIFCQRALEITQELAPDSLYLASAQHSLAIVAWRNGDLGRAMELFQRALEIERKLAPDSNHFAEILHAIGLLYREKRPTQLETVDQFLRDALDTLEAQLARFGGSHEIRGGFRAKYHEYYRDALEVQLELGQAGIAFHTLERSRARSFLEELIERDTVFTADIPEQLDRERRRHAVRFDRTQQQLAHLYPRDHAEQIDELRYQLRRLRGEARGIEEKIRRASPRLAALQYPRPLDLDAARAVLDPGTLMLSYSVGEESTMLFTLSKEHGLRVETLAIGEDQLRDQVQTLRRQIRNVRRPGSQRMRRFEESARSLYSTLIGPVADWVEASDRLLILADGPLHYLPWGTLRRDTAGGGQYLLRWKPLHLALSVTVYAEFRKLRREGDASPPSVQLAAFGDPRYPGSRESAGRHDDPVVRSAAERVPFDWGSLPYTRREVEGIAGVYPEQRVRAYLGEEATEEHAKSIGRDVRILHFATHGHLDERFPLNSFLALTIPEVYSEDRDNGLLQAWEIFERVRLDADLVVLSACETALGKEQGGEGLIGLTRAFQYAGARSVVASLWRVEDRSTAELMTRFYRHLREGKAKDEALRAAQLELLRGPIQVQGETGEYQEIEASAPYYWAAFQIYGDWK